MQRACDRPQRLGWIILVAVAAQAIVFAFDSEALAVVGVIIALAPTLVACVAAARRSAGPLRVAWSVATLSMGLWLLAMVLYALAPDPSDPSRVSIAEVPLLLSTALSPLALVAWPRHSHGRRGRGGLLLDALLSVGALLYLSWPLLLHRFVEQRGQVAATGALYTALDIAMVTVCLLALAGRPRRHERALLTILCAVVALVTADVTFSILSAAGSGRADQAIAGVSVLGALLVLRAARMDDAQATAARPWPRWFPLLAPWLPLGGALLMGVYMTVSDQITGTVRAIALTVLVLTIVRLAVTARENFVLTRRLEHRAGHDPLTGLPNRTQLTDRLRAAVDRLGDRPGHVAVLLLDIDHFRTVNETLGHDTGDVLLCAVAERFREAVAPAATVARLGGDEFVVVLPDLPADPEAAHAAALAVAGELRHGLARGVQVGPRRHVLRASGGLTLSDGTADVRLEELVGDADLAMYAAKDAGRDGVTVFSSALRTRATERARLEHELRTGLERGELRVVFQPIFDLLTGEITAAEALVRWQHPDHGLLAPGAFLEVAERAGLMPRLGELVLAQALAEQRRWPRTRDGRHRRVTVNLSADDLRDANLPSRIRAALERAGRPGEALVLEITEKLVIDDVATAARVLQELADAGVQIAFDDFGSGHSGLSHLRDLPVDIVKLDRSFVCELDRPRGAVLVSTVLELSRALGMRTVAEGIEHPEQVARLTELGCDGGQGFHLGKPMSAEQLRSRIDNLVMEKV